MSIPLPPLPEAYDAADYGGRSTGPILHTADQLRARDQEIVRCVLEAAAKKARHSSEWLADAIRALEFKHVE